MADTTSFCSVLRNCCSNGNWKYCIPTCHPDEVEEKLNGSVRTHPPSFPLDSFTHFNMWAPKPSNYMCVCVCVSCVGGGTILHDTY